MKPGYEAWRKPSTSAGLLSVGGVKILPSLNVQPEMMEMFLWNSPLASNVEGAAGRKAPSTVGKKMSWLVSFLVMFSYLRTAVRSCGIGTLRMHVRTFVLFVPGQPASSATVEVLLTVMLLVVPVSPLGGPDSMMARWKYGLPGKGSACYLGTCGGRVSYLFLRRKSAAIQCPPHRHSARKA